MVLIQGWAFGPRNNLSRAQIFFQRSLPNSACRTSLNGVLLNLESATVRLFLVIDIFRYEKQYVFLNIFFAIFFKLQSKFGEINIERLFSSGSL